MKCNLLLLLFLCALSATGYSQDIPVLTRTHLPSDQVFCRNPDLSKYQALLNGHRIEESVFNQARAAYRNDNGSENTNIGITIPFTDLEYMLMLSCDRHLICLNWVNRSSSASDTLLIEAVQIVMTDNNKIVHSASSYYSPSLFKAFLLRLQSQPNFNKDSAEFLFHPGKVQYSEDNDPTEIVLVELKYNGQRLAYYDISKPPPPFKRKYNK